MSITVGAIYTQFPNFDPKDMIKLMNGRTDFTGRDEVSLSNIASYQGKLSNELSIFTAKSEGKSFTNSLAEGKRNKVTAEAGIKNDITNDNNVNQNGLPAAIPMDKSIFDIKNKNREV